MHAGNGGTSEDKSKSYVSISPPFGGLEPWLLPPLYSPCPYKGCLSPTQA